MAMKVKAQNQFRYGPNLVGVKRSVRKSVAKHAGHPLLEADGVEDKPTPDEIFISGSQLNMNSKMAFGLGVAFGLQVDVDPALDPYFGTCFQTTLAVSD